MDKEVSLLQTFSLREEYMESRKTAEVVTRINNAKNVIRKPICTYDLFKCSLTLIEKPDWLWTLQLNVDCANDISGRYIISAKYPLLTVEFSGEIKAGSTILTTDEKMVETGMLRTRGSEFRVELILNRSVGMEIPLKRSPPPVTIETSDETVQKCAGFPRKQDQHFPLIPNLLRHIKVNFQKIRTNWRRFWKTPITIRLSKKKPEPYLEEDTEYVCYIPV